MFDPQQLAQMDFEHVLHPMQDWTHYSKTPLILDKGKGSVVTDVEGKEYIDAFAGLWNVNVGFGRDELAEAAAEQIRTLAYASGYSGSSNPPAILLADRLAKLAPGRPHGHLLHHWRRGVQRDGLQDGPLLLEGQRQAREGEDLLPRQRATTARPGRPPWPPA